MRALAKLSREEGGLLALPLAEETTEGTYKTGYMWADGRILLAHRQTHLLPVERDAGIALGDRSCPVVETATGRVALVLGAEGLVPEAVRCLMLEGADLLLWLTGDLGFDLLPLARCRADENRAYVAAAGPAVPKSGALIVSTTGQVVASSLAEKEMAVSAHLNRALARWKDMAPGTNVVLDRQPGTYGALVRSARKPHEGGPGA
jgi:predicted amidohydrolase